eukprot:1160825-Pelagomonas_calceolata.AAC.5
MHGTQGYINDGDVLVPGCCAVLHCIASQCMSMDLQCAHHCVPCRSLVRTIACYNIDEEDKEATLLGDADEYLKHQPPAVEVRVCVSTRDMLSA